MLKPEHVRAFLLDRAARDNIYSSDIDFDEDSITTAFMIAAGDYNAIPPLVETVTPGSMPGLEEDSTFCLGVAAALLRSEIMRLSRNEITYDAGGVQVTHGSQVLQWYLKLEPMLRQQFNSQAHTRKIARNIKLAYGAVG